MAETRHHFSKRTAWDLSQSSFSAAIAQARADHREVLDLTLSNPTQCGFDYDADSILRPLSAANASAQTIVYDPDPRGMLSAREAVVRYYADHGAAIDPESVLLTTSTSEAYSFLFRLLCDAGDEVLVAQPSYPLFEFLAGLDDVLLKPYPLFYDYGWWIDFAALEQRIGPRTRAILVVHPNNPTGHWTHKAERQRLEALCIQRGLALLVDEVFLDYPFSSFGGKPAASFAVGPHPALTFVLSGISKICALTQMKVAWTTVSGPACAVAEALGRLEIVADTFLSMNTLAQLALPVWLANRSSLQRQIQARTQLNLDTLRASGLEVLKVEAGWSAILRLRGVAESAAYSLAETLLAEAATIVHPGEFYGLARNRFAVVSLLTPPNIFYQGVAKICLTIGQSGFGSTSDTNEGM